jgi:hypothetical protein
VEKETEADAVAAHEVLAHAGLRVVSCLHVNRTELERSLSLCMNRVLSLPLSRFFFPLHFETLTSVKLWWAGTGPGSETLRHCERTPAVIVSSTTTVTHSASPSAQYSFQCASR